MSKNIYLNIITKDFVLTAEKNLRLTDTLTEFVSQKIENTLLFFYGEWFLDFERGIPYFQKIFTKNPDIDLINAIFVREIKAIAEIQEILLFETEYDPAQRIFNVTFEIKASDGTIVENSFSI